MIRPAIATLSVAACLLAATLAWEFGAFAVQRPVDVPRPHLQATVSRPAKPDQTAQWVSAILGRPLFSPDRRPDPDSAADTGGAAASQGLPRLAGVVVGPFGRSAIFAAEGRKPLVVTEGGKVDAWTVQSIEIGSVKVSGPGGDVTLQPSFQASSEASTGGAPAGPSIGLPPRR